MMYEVLAGNPLHRSLHTSPFYLLSPAAAATAAAPASSLHQPSSTSASALTFASEAGSSLTSIILNNSTYNSSMPAKAISLSSSDAGVNLYEHFAADQPTGGGSSSSSAVSDALRAAGQDVLYKIWINNASSSTSSAVAASLSSLSSSSIASLNEPIFRAEEVQYLVNATADVPIEYTMVLMGYIMPVLLILTIISNSLVVIVLSRKHMITPTNIVLLAMAISDMLTLIFPAPWYLYMYTLANHSRILSPPTACYAFHIMTEVIPAFFHTASIWLTLLLAIQRYIYVCHPTLARTWCTVPRVVKSMIMVFVLAFLHQSTRFVDRSFSAIRVEWQNEVHRGCRFQTADWVARVVNEDIYFASYYCFRILFVHIIPCTALVILNLLLFRALKNAQKTRDRLFKENKKSECRKLRDSNCTTLMLIVVVTVFLCTETPLAICTVLHVTQNILPIAIVEYKTLNLTILFTNFFISMSYPVNFAIYCGMSLMFRETFKDLFIRGTRSSDRKRSATASKFSVVTGNGPRLTATFETNL